MIKNLVLILKNFLKNGSDDMQKKDCLLRIEELKEYGAIPVYAFNFVDYVLWKNREELKKAYDVKFQKISNLHIVVL